MRAAGCIVLTLHPRLLTDMTRDDIGGPERKTRRWFAGARTAVPFNLSRWFALAGLVSIASISGVAGYLISAFVTDRMVRQEGQLTMEFVENLVIVEKQRFVAPFSGGGRPVPADVEEAFVHLARLPGVLRANAYDRERRIVWSSDRELVGRRFDANDELDRALAGELVVHPKAYDATADRKAEHLHLARRANFFVEIYLPVRDESGERVMGAIEFYKNPVALFNALQNLRAYIAVGAALAGVFLYLALFGLVRRADLVMREQQRRLVDSETLAAVGEMGSAVAHGIRNPLASIRSSAELILVTDEQTGREAATDIIAESDRLGAWVRQLLSYARPLDAQTDKVALTPLLEQIAEEFGRELARRGIDVALKLPAELPRVRADALLLGQVVNGLVANAVEAMERDGHLEIACESARGGREVLLSVRDDGPGMTNEQLRRAGKPFYTTKAKGLGVGLALARRIVERFGGSLVIDSEPGKGTTVRIALPTV